MSEKKQTSYKVLMGLILLMFFLQTINIIANWYIAWLGFIYYSDSPDKALDALEVDAFTSLLLQAISSMFDLLLTLRLAIADSIMVSNHSSLLVNITHSLRLQGLEVLDHMQWKLDSSGCSSDLQYWVNRYVMDLGDKSSDKRL